MYHYLTKAVGSFSLTMYNYRVLLEIIGLFKKKIIIIMIPISHDTIGALSMITVENMTDSKIKKNDFKRILYDRNNFNLQLLCVIYKGTKKTLHNCAITINNNTFISTI